MESWTWSDVLIYFICVLLSCLWYLSIGQIIMVAIKFLWFIGFTMPLAVVQEFSLITFRVRSPERAFATFFEFSAILYTRWVLKTFKAEVVHDVFFGDHHARLFFIWRKFKYGTENIGDFDYDSVDTGRCQGYWVRSKSRRNRKPDLVIYFVPGAMSGGGSSYLYLEYLSILLVELQVCGFRNPAVFCLDAKYHKHFDVGYVSFMNHVIEGYRFALDEFPDAKRLLMGSGLGGTALLGLLLYIARPHVGVEGVLKKTPPEQSEDDESGILKEADTQVGNEHNSGQVDESWLPSAIIDESTGGDPGIPGASASPGPLPANNFPAQSTTSNSGFYEAESTHKSTGPDYTNATESEDCLLLSALESLLTASKVNDSDECLHEELRLTNGSLDSKGVHHTEDLLENPEAPEEESKPSEISITEPVGSVSRHPAHPAQSGLCLPDAAMLTSPLSRTTMDRTDSYPDFLTPRVLDQLGSRLVGIQEEQCLWAMPGCVYDKQWWTEAMPKRGIFFMYGGRETISREIQSMIDMLRSTDCARVVAECEGDQTHAWPIVSAYLGRSTTEQMYGISQVARRISNMLVMDCLFDN